MAETPEDMVDDLNSDSDDSESSFEEVEVTEEEMQLITQLENELQANPNLYDKHIQVSRA